MLTRPRRLAEGDVLAGFKCGEPIVDDWLLERATQAQRTGTATVYVCYSEQGQLAGYYTLSAHTIDRNLANGWLSRNTPEQIPAILLGRLGVDRCWQGQGLGKDLLADAIKRSRSIATQIGAKAMIVEPANQAAKGFYLKYGFKPFKETSLMYARLV